MSRKLVIDEYGDGVLVLEGVPGKYSNHRVWDLTHQVHISFDDDVRDLLPTDNIEGLKTLDWSQIESGKNKAMAPIDGLCDKCKAHQYNLVPYGWDLRGKTLKDTQWLCGWCYDQRPIRIRLNAKTWKSIFRPTYGFEFRKHGRSRDIILDVRKRHFMITISW